MFSISTVWNAWRHREAGPLVDELRGLGFKSLELSFGLPPRMVEEIGKMVESGRVSVCSLHNYCPAPLIREGKKLTHDLLPLSNSDEEERKWAVRQAMRTIDAARVLGAPAVVIHLGKVPIYPISPRLMALIENGEGESGRYQRLKEKLYRKREAKKGRYLSQAARSLRDLATHAEDTGVKLAIENRYYPEEIPSLDEIGQLIEEVDSPAVGYWHDLGHATVRENIGWDSHMDYLERYGQYLVGLHIHDVINTRDHKAPFQGAIDYTRFRECLARDVLKVLEIHPGAAADEIRHGLSFLRRLIGDDSGEMEESQLGSE